ncbi:hypothetical protein BZL30_6341 [Mycobacterium kansasii]|uniref:Uncharacterized protein n=1 Tax=Mycobacterium kansasii TaxID=1768 RepID=A0A1V3WVQ4_MYCKA|nr:hypothetical protein BZL30_6341 [Mycobacterium kansasii]OOK74782.1 hypothetical protein BZL29_4368 [Mycobacterium kansasii]
MAESWSTARLGSGRSPPGVPMQYDADVNPRDKAAASAPLLHRMRS